MLKAYKYRIYPTEEQITQLSKTFGSCRFVYNYYLSMKKDLYQNDEKSMSKIDCNNHCNQQLKNEFVWLKDIDKFALTNAIYDLDSAYKMFFKENSGFPTFKNKRNHNKSYTTNFTNNNIEVDFNGSEDLKISNIIKNYNFTKSKADLGWWDFMRKLDYKAKWYGRTYHKINTWHTGSQTCSYCGALNKKVRLLSVREWVCEVCGSIHYRDKNAVADILSKGLKELDLS